MGRSVDCGRVLRGGARHGPQFGVEINGGEPGNRRRLLRDGVPSARSQSKGLVDHVADRLRCLPAVGTRPRTTEFFVAVRQRVRDGPSPGRSPIRFRREN